MGAFRDPMQGSVCEDYSVRSFTDATLAPQEASSRSIQAGQASQ